MFVGLPVTWPRLVIRVSIPRMLAANLICPYMSLLYTKKLNACSYIIYLLHLKLWQHCSLLVEPVWLWSHVVLALGCTIECKPQAMFSLKHVVTNCCLPNVRKHYQYWLVCPTQLCQNVQSYWNCRLLVVLLKYHACWTVVQYIALCTLVWLNRHLLQCLRGQS